MGNGDLRYLIFITIFVIKYFKTLEYKKDSSTKKGNCDVYSFNNNKRKMFTDIILKILEMMILYFFHILDKFLISFSVNSKLKQIQSQTPSILSSHRKKSQKGIKWTPKTNPTTTKIVVQIVMWVSVIIQMSSILLKCNYNIELIWIFLDNFYNHIFQHIQIKFFS